MARWWAARHAMAVLIFPVTVVVIIPAWIARSSGIEFTLPTTTVEWLASVFGLVALAGGGALFIACVTRFGSEGEGTLAPWDPPARLVVSGPYALVRNPMISGVILLLLGLGFLLRSAPHLEWAGIFFVINAVYIPLLEEPQLRKRFGLAYEEYSKKVPRLIPRIRPWRPGEE